MTKWLWLRNVLGSLLLASLASAHPHDESYEEFVKRTNSPMTNRDYQNRLYFVISGTEANVLDVLPFAKYEQPLPFDNSYLYSVDKQYSHIVQDFNIPGYQNPDEPERQNHLARLSRREAMAVSSSLVRRGVESLQVMHPKRIEKRVVPVEFGSTTRYANDGEEKIALVQEEFGIKDPLFAKQWHLFNPYYPGNDVNVTGVWAAGFAGEGIAVAVVDDGLDMYSADLKDNYFAEGSWDFNDNGPEPRPKLDDDHHGTRCAGEIAAVKNDVCGVGVAYNASVAGIRILSGFITESDEALALNYKMDKNHIYSCSWGPPDDGKTVAAPGALIQKSLIHGVSEGRDKKGSIFVFASGNGAGFGDNCNYDGYTNSIFSITVAAIDHKGLSPPYSEKCSANMVVTCSAGSGEYIHTTDIHGRCADYHGGTSAAAPLAAGIFSLALQARPELTWRDLQYVVRESAVQVHPEEDWQKTPTGKMYSHQYGYGQVDSYKLVETAKSWNLVKPQAWYRGQWVSCDLDVGYQSPVESVYTVTEDMLKKANVERLEHVNVIVNIESSNRGAVDVTLIGPAGVESRLGIPRPMDTSDGGLHDWTYMSVAHWGESGVGDWKLVVRQDLNEEVTMKVKSWKLILWGEAENASKAKHLPNPGDEDKDTDEDEVPGTKPTSTLASSPTSTSADVTSTVGQDEPTSATSAAAEPTSSSTPADDEGEKEGEDENGNSGWSAIWSSIPTFGFSHRTAMWIGGAVVIILCFIGGLTIYLFVMRRKRNLQYQNNSYEFNLLPDEGYSEDEISLATMRSDDESDGEDNAESAKEDDDAKETEEQRQKRSLIGQYRSDSRAVERSETNTPTHDESTLFDVGEEESD